MKRSSVRGGGHGSNQYVLRGSSQTAERVAATLTPDDVARLELEAIANAFGDVHAPGKNHDHLLRLAAELAPDPREFSYTGDVIDFGDDEHEQCACGAHIRYAFPVKRDRDDKTVNIGSTCIQKSVPFLTTTGADVLAEDLVAAYERHMAALAEAERNARDERNRTVVESLHADYEPAQEWVQQVRDQMRGSLGWRWRLDEKAPRLVAPQPASTPGRTAASLRKRYRSWWNTMTSNGQVPPVPQDPQLRFQVYTDCVTQLDRARQALERFERTHGERLAAAPHSWLQRRHEEAQQAVTDAETVKHETEQRLVAAGVPVPPPDPTLKKPRRSQPSTDDS